jgi:osmotically-inducible protein OsmY
MGRHHEDRYGRGGAYRRDRADDRGYDRDDQRGYAERTGDEVRSWFGDDDAQRRRRMDEQRDRQRERQPASDWDRANRQHPDWNRLDWRSASRGRSQSDQPDWNRTEWNRGEWDSPDRNRADWNRQDWSRSGPRPNWNPSQWDDRARAEWTRQQEAYRDQERGNRGYQGYESAGGFRDDDRYTSPSYRPTRNWSGDEGRGESSHERWGRGPKGYQRSDSRVLEDVCDRLTYSDVDAENIEVHVEKGEVTLSGSVRDRADKRRAEDVVEEVAGVRDVHNNIRVHRADRGLGQSDTSASEQPGTVLGVNPTAGSTIANAPPKVRQ